LHYLKDNMKNICLVQCQQYPPVIHPLKEEHVVEAGKDWRILCSGEESVDWILPNGSKAEATHEKDHGDVPRF